MKSSTTSVKVLRVLEFAKLRNGDEAGWDFQDLGLDDIELVFADGSPFDSPNLTVPARTKQLTARVTSRAIARRYFYTVECKVGQVLGRHQDGTIHDTAELIVSADESL